MRQRRSPAYSITTRLAVLFALALAALALATGGYLYHALTMDITSREGDELRGKMKLAVQTVSTLATVDGLSTELARLVAGHERLAIYVVGSDGELLYASRPPRVPVDARSALLAVAQPRLFETDTDSVRALGARATQGSGDPVAVFIESSTSETDKLLASHLREIVGAVLLSAMIGLAAAYAIARSGLQPLREMANTARLISIEQLDQRLSVETAPVELRELAGAFNAMLDRLQDSFSRLDEFSSDLAHELRTPLSNLIGHSQVVLSRSRSADDYRSALESNMEEFERLSRMVGDMLFIARADHPQAAVKRLPVDLRRVAEKMQQFYEPVLAENGVTLQVEGGGRIEAEPLLIERAVSNLVSNAVRHASKDSEIMIRIQDEGSRITLEVSNRGDPIPPEVRDRLFSRFLHADTDEHSGGIGLGLAIVQSIMKLHGGTVTLDGAAQGETRFRLSFPAAAVDPTPS